jgi:hypothetical protein
MSQEIDLRRDDDDEWPNTASVPPALLSRKRSRHKEKPSNDGDPRKENGSGDKTATGSAEFVVNLELEDEVEVSPHRKRRGVVRSNQSAKNTQILKGLHATEKGGGSEDVEGIASAATHPMKSDLKQTSRDDGSPIQQRHSHTLLVSAVAGGNQQVIDEEDLTTNTSLGREPPISIDDIDDSSEEALPLPHQAGEWAKKFEELGEYRKRKGHCIFLRQDPEYVTLSKWVFFQRREHRRMVGGKGSFLTPDRVKALECIGVIWNPSSPSGEGHLSELAEYRKIHGHCNVPRNYSENSKLGKWVGTQRMNYRLHLEGKTSSITFSRIQELECLGFEWNSHGATSWGDRFSELAEYQSIRGHCNVPKGYSENAKLANWVRAQRDQCKLHLEGKPSQMTLSRIQALESLSFEWKTSRGRRKGIPKKPSVDDDATRVRERAVEASEHVQATAQTQKDFSGRESRSNSVDVAFVPEESDCNGEVHLGYIPGRTEEI